MTSSLGPLYLPPDAIDTGKLKRVLVIMLRHHGDVLLTSPVFEVLAQVAPGVEVDVLLYADTRPLVEFNPRLKLLHTIDRAWKKAGMFGQLSGEWQLLRGLQRRSYDLVVHLSNHRRGAYLCRLLRPRWSVAPKLRDAPALWNGSFTHLYPGSASAGSGNPLLRRHKVDQNLDALRRLGIAILRAPALRLEPGPEGDRAAAAFRSAHAIDGPYVLVQPTSRWMFKCWPIEQNVQLLRALLKRGQTVILSCAPDEREQAMLASIVDQLAENSGQLPAGLKLANQDATLARLAALIRDARLFVGIDSAPMHMAAAMGTPSVALFGPSGESNWGPWRGDRRLVFEVVTSEQFACRPCGQDGCGGGKVSDCLVQLPMQKVLGAIDRVLAQSDTFVDV